MREKRGTPTARAWGVGRPLRVTGTVLALRQDGGATGCSGRLLHPDDSGTVRWNGRLLLRVLATLFLIISSRWTRRRSVFLPVGSVLSSTRRVRLLPSPSFVSKNADEYSRIWRLPLLACFVSEQFTFTASESPDRTPKAGWILMATIILREGKTISQGWVAIEREIKEAGRHR